MNIDMTTLTEDASAKVWDELNGGGAAPFHEQDALLQHSVKSKVLPVILTVLPVVQEAHKAEITALKDQMIAIINEAHDAGHDPEFTIMALMAQLSDD
jgi:hypothetical protein